MLRVAIIESDADTRTQIQMFVQRYARSEGVDIRAEEFDRGDRFLARYQNLYDVIFMGIELEGLDGMEAARRLRKLDRDVVLVFVTALARYAIRGYEVDALDFVLKPLNYYAFSVKLERALRRARQRAEEHILIRTAAGMRRMEIRDIHYLETQSRMLCYHTSSGDYSVRGTLRDAAAQLADYAFAKCNQCYLVNLQHVTDVRDDTVTVAGTELEISRRNRKTFLDAVVAYIGGAH